MGFEAVDNRKHACGNNRRQPKWEETDTVYSELNITKETVGIACVWQRLKGKQESRKGWEWNKGKVSGILGLEVVGIQSWRWASTAIDLWTIFGFLWVVLTWKLGQKLRKLAVIDQVLTVGDQLLQRWLVLLDFYCHTWYVWHSIVHKHIQYLRQHGTRWGYRSREEVNLTTLWILDFIKNVFPDMPLELTLCLTCRHLYGERLN